MLTGMKGGGRIPNCRAVKRSTITIGPSQSGHFQREGAGDSADSAGAAEGSGCRPSKEKHNGNRAARRRVARKPK